jgi:hypothetical protein
MDDFEQLVNTYRVRASAAPAAKLHVLLDLERMRDPHIVTFLLTVLADRHEVEGVRIYVLKRLRSGDGLLVPNDRPSVAKAIIDALADTSTVELRLQAALASGTFTDIDGVLSALSAVSLAQGESIDLRYPAFTSLERAGPTPECIVLLPRIADDVTLGRSARSVLSAWHIE